MALGHLDRRRLRDAARADPVLSLWRALGLLQRQSSGRSVGRRSDRARFIDGPAEPATPALFSPITSSRILDRSSTDYFRNVERVKAAAARARIELIPAVFSIGYSNGLLAHDPNLAEGLPVVDQPFVVKNGVAVLDSPPGGPAPNGGLEEAATTTVSPASPFRTTRASPTFADRSTLSIRDGPPAGSSRARKARRSAANTRLVQTRQASAAHRLPVLVLGEDPRPRAGGSSSCWRWAASRAGRSSRSTRGAWNRTRTGSEIEVVFNSLDQREVNLYVGFWGDGKGRSGSTISQLEELALVNVLRRKGAP